MALKGGIPVDLESLVDLTLPVHAGMPVSIRERPVVVERRMTHQRDGICASSLEMGTHAGTHIDVREPPLRLDAVRVARSASVWGGLKPGTAVVLWTGWDRFFGLTEMHGHPYLAKDAAQFLVDAGAAVVAIDAIGLQGADAAPVRAFGWRAPP